MMAQKHLHELLQEDQEPFFLNNYISNKRTQLKRPSPNTTLQLKKQKPPSPSPSPTHFCKKACFLSFHNSPDIRKSPLFEFASPVKSPKRSSNPIFLHIPATTASLLLEAALRIQKQSKTKSHSKNNGLFGSFFKRLTQRSRRNKRGEIQDDEKTKVSVKDLLRNTTKAYYNGSKEEEEENQGSSNGRPSSAVWSDKSLDMETSSSGHSSVEEEAHEFVDKNKQNVDCACFDNHSFFCESPFRFVLQKSPSSSSGRRTPEFTSPAVSPSRHRTQDKENNGTDGVNKFQSVEEEEEEEKEQCSPVSVLDPPFEYDDDGHENDDEDGRFDLECSYANVQRTKQQLLNRLRRFEQLAELDPVELEKRMQDQEDKEYSETFTEEDDGEEDEIETSSEEIVFEILCHSSVHDRRQDPEDLKRLVYDLLKEEEEVVDFSEDRNMVLRRVCKRLELWNEVETNTIDMMIEEDLSREESGRKKNAEETRELAREVEVAIFCYLVEEFLEELVC